VAFDWGRIDVQAGMSSDALYLWCKEGRDEIHTWNPDALTNNSFGN
jgi:hypothetical protein